MSAMTKSIGNDVGQRQLINDFLIGIYRSHGRSYAEPWWGRITTEHWMSPIDSRINYGDINALAFVAIRRSRKRRHIIWIASIKLRSINVRHALIEVRLKNSVRMDLLHPGHVGDRGHGSFGDSQGHPVVNQRVA